MNVLELSEQEIQRRNSLDELRQLGIDPYPAAEYKVTAHSDDIKANFSDESDEKREVCIAGRLMGRRVMGKASFAELMDSKGRIQVYYTRRYLSGRRQNTIQQRIQKVARPGRLHWRKGFCVPYADRRNFSTRTGTRSAFKELAPPARG